MSGHSKWHNIRLKKGKVDAQRGNLFTKLSKEIIVAAKSGQPDPEANFRLKLAVAKAREANMPSDNIKRAIARASGEGKGETLEQIRYEGYGAGVAVIVDAVTDSRNRTASEMRYIFSRNGGNLGESGCVAWMFDERGVIGLTTDGMSEETLLGFIMLDGVLDVQQDAMTADIITEPRALNEIREHVGRALSQLKDAKVVSTAIELVPRSRVAVSSADSAAVLGLLSSLEDHPDVSAVFSNAEMADSLLEAWV